MPTTIINPINDETLNNRSRWLSALRLNKDVVRRVLGNHYHPNLDSDGPSWLTFIGHTKDSLYVADPSVWSQVHDEGVQILENVANIRVPVIAAIEGRVNVQFRICLLANVVVVAEGRPSMTCHTLPVALCRVTESLPPGVTALGAGRAKAFLLNPQPLTAHTTREWGVVSEVPNGKLLARRAGLALHESSGGHTPQNSRALHTTVEGAHRTSQELSRRGPGGG